MILLSHPTGNANIRHCVQAIHEADLLEEFWTCISWNPDHPLARALPPKLRAQFARRAFDARLRSQTRTAPWRELGRLFSPGIGNGFLTRHETGPFCIDAVFRDFDNRVAKRVAQSPHLSGVYCGEDGACATFRQAHRQGIRCFYDLPIGYWKAGQAVYKEEQDREPEWAGTLTGLQDSPAKLERKDDELRMADMVFVASAFTRSTLQLAPEFHGKVFSAPYGAPPVHEHPPTAREEHAPKLNILFVGSLTQRKGLSYLFRAVRPIRALVNLTIIGRKTGGACARLDRDLADCRWIESLPHRQILEEMRRNDVLVFPSLFEGFGLVILEAMSQGMTVITTPNTAGPDVITDGRDGFIVPVRTAEAITAHLVELADDRDRLLEIRTAAWETARSRSWEGYRNAVANALRSELRPDAYAPDIPDGIGATPGVVE